MFPLITWRGQAICLQKLQAVVITLSLLNFLEEYLIVKPGPYLGFFVCGGKLGFREISDQYSYKKQPSKIRHYVRKKNI